MQLITFSMFIIFCLIGFGCTQQEPQTNRESRSNTAETTGTANQPGGGVNNPPQNQQPGMASPAPTMQMNMNMGGPGSNPGAAPGSGSSGQ